MIGMRVTVGSASYRSMLHLQSASSRLAELQDKLSSGQQIMKPSDDPSGTVRALALRGDLKRSTQYAANADDAIGWMSTADTAYKQAVNLLQNARTLVVQGLNTGANDAAASTALANQVDALRGSLLGVANTTYNGRPVFGGTTAGTVAYDPNGNYVGDDGSITRAVGANNTVTINQTGPQAFGAAGSDVFSLLDIIANTLRVNPSGLGSALGQLDTAISTVTGAQATEGATYQRVQAASTALTTDNTNLKTELSQVQDADAAELAIEVATANTTYQASLQVTANISQLSLMDFLK
jgi:flagellar hook-associated protein 3 FlgL